MITPSPTDTVRRTWPDFAAVRRWHFYAGLFCLPFFVWLSVTGPIYLFRPEIEEWLDRPYESLQLNGPRANPSAEVSAAIAAMPGSTFSRYEPPATPTGAAQVVVSRDGTLFRVYVHPGDLHAMYALQDDHRPMTVVAHLHGQLLLGKQGSMVVEVAGSWGIVMILTGLYLWLPRSASSWGGVVYPRLRQKGRLFWRDLHAVAGLWVSLVTLFLLLSGLPWSTAWGNYFTWARNQWAATAGTPDWPIGGEVRPAAPVSPPATKVPALVAEKTAAHGHGEPSNPSLGFDLRALDKLVPVAAQLDPPRPVWISPPARGEQDWQIESRAQNRPLRVVYKVAPDSGRVTGKVGYAERNVVDRVVNVVIATHEGQYFGRLNQAILLLNAAALLLLLASATVMWWRRRPGDVLGAPAPLARPRFSALLVVVILALSALLPLFGLSLVLVLVIERILLRRLPSARRWLGLEDPRSGHVVVTRAN